MNATRIDDKGLPLHVVMKPGTLRAVVIYPPVLNQFRNRTVQKLYPIKFFGVKYAPTFFLEGAAIDVMAFCRDAVERGIAGDPVRTHSRSRSFRPDLI
jgi:hypothetical protein